jgi:hypothetical protein
MEFTFCMVTRYLNGSEGRGLMGDVIISKKKFLHETIENFKNIII